MVFPEIEPANRLARMSDPFSPRHRSAEEIVDEIIIGVPLKEKMAGKAQEIIQKELDRPPGEKPEFLFGKDGEMTAQQAADLYKSGQGLYILFPVHLPEKIAE